MPRSEQYKLTQKARGKFKAYIDARVKMKQAQAKFDAAREKTVVTRAEAVSARKVLLQRFPDAELPAFPEDVELLPSAPSHDAELGSRRAAALKLPPPAKTHDAELDSRRAAAFERMLARRQEQ